MGQNEPMLSPSSGSQHTPSDLHQQKSWYRFKETHWWSRHLWRGKGKYFPFPLQNLSITPMAWSTTHIGAAANYGGENHRTGLLIMCIISHKTRVNSPVVHGTQTVLTAKASTMEHMRLGTMRSSVGGGLWNECAPPESSHEAAWQQAIPCPEGT